MTFFNAQCRKTNDVLYYLTNNLQLLLFLRVIINENTSFRL